MTRVVVMGWLALVSTLLLTVAGILTPIGLGEAIVLSGSTTATFLYAKDSSAFGGTAANREQYSNSRTCNFGKSPCPGVKENDTVSILADISGPEKGPVTFYQNYIAQNITDCFSSGSKGSLVSSPFDIQFRQFDVSFNEQNLTAKKNTTGTFYWTEHTLLLDTIACREGLVIDAVNGGIGFRNHTIPALPPTVHGAAWQEDILWLEPDTFCVGTNWSISTEFQLAPFSQGGLSMGANTRLIYDGHRPDHGFEAKFPTFKDTILSPDLLGRVHLAAEVFDYRLSKILNLDQMNVNSEAYDISVLYQLSSSFLGLSSHRQGLVFGPLRDSWSAYYGETSKLTWSSGREYHLPPTEIVQVCGMVKSNLYISWLV